jgi:hypothetical protein
VHKGFGDSDVYIGLDKIGQSNYSKWNNGKPLTYTDWEKNGLDNFNGQHCVVA